MAVKNFHILLALASTAAFTFAAFWVYGKDDFADVNINKKTFPCFKYKYSDQICNHVKPRGFWGLRHDSPEVLEREGRDQRPPLERMICQISNLNQIIMTNH